MLIKIEPEQIPQSLSLHDCIISSIKTQDKNIIFTFDDGIWLHPNNCHNKSEYSVKTKKAELIFKGYETDGFLFYQKRGRRGKEKIFVSLLYLYSKIYGTH